MKRKKMGDTGGRRSRKREKFLCTPWYRLRLNPLTASFQSLFDEDIPNLLKYVCNVDIYDYMTYHRLGQIWCSLCTRMAFHSQSVNLLSKLACALGHGGRGCGDFPLAPIPTDREMEASVSVWECSSDVTGYTASSNNPAGTFATETQFWFHQDGAA